MGHFDEFPPTAPSVGCRLGQGTFAEAINCRDAPKTERARQYGGITVTVYLTFHRGATRRRGAKATEAIVVGLEKHGIQPIDALGDMVRKSRDLVNCHRNLRNLVTVICHGDLQCCCRHDCPHRRSRYLDAAPPGDCVEAAQSPFDARS